MRKTLLFVLLLMSTALMAQRRGVSILGDSYSTFRDFVQPANNLVWYPVDSVQHNDVVSVRQTWWHLFISQQGFRLCQNNSYSGSTICHTGYNGDDYRDRSFVTRAGQLGTPDIIIVFGGTNDSWANVPIGNFKYSEWSLQDLYTFRPAMAKLLDNLGERYPGTEVYVIINSELKEDITQSMRTICDHYGVRWIQLHDIDKQWGHPSQKGMRQIAEQLAAVIK